MHASLTHPDGDLSLQLDSQGFLCPGSQQSQVNGTLRKAWVFLKGLHCQMEIIS